MARIPKNILAFNFYDFIPSPPVVLKSKPRDGRNLERVKII